MKMLKLKMILRYINPNKLFFLLFMVLSFQVSLAQDKVIDKVISVVGSNIVLQSDLEAQYSQILSQNKDLSLNEKKSRCIVLEQLLFQKLLLNQSKLDSLKVSDTQVESEMDRRLRFFISQIGSEEKLEEYYGKSIALIKDEFREMIKNQLLTQQMQSKITSDIAITPSEVRNYLKSLPDDSIPIINSELEIGQIVIRPKISNDAKSEARNKIENIRQRVLNGEKFGALAVLYSEDPGSAKKSGELGFVTRGTFVPEFESIAYKIKEGETSEVFETPFGFHFMQLIERRGDQINVRHILISPNITSEDLTIAKDSLDVLYRKLSTNDSILFSEAALKYSDDKDTKYNGGLIINPITGTTKFETDQIDPSIFFTVDKLKVGQISTPVLMQESNGKQAYRIFFLKSRTEPHKANLKDDYQRIQDSALELKKKNVVSSWIKKKLSNTYFKIDPEYSDCVFENFKVQ